MNKKLENDTKILGLHNHISELSVDGMMKFLDECLIDHADVIAITDHRTLSSYYKLFSELTDDQLEKYRSIKFVLGMELTGSFEFVDCHFKKTNIVMNILCYNIDIDKYNILWNFIKEKYNNYLNSREFQENELKRLIKISIEQGFNADYDKIEINDVYPYAARNIAYALINPKYVKDNIEKGLLPEIVSNPRSFFNRYCKTDTPFYLNTSAFFPSIQEVVNIINKCRALAFLDHPAAYFPKSGDIKQNNNAWLNSEKFVLDFFKNIQGVKGLELVHPSSLDNKKYYEFLCDYSKACNLFVSGGTDYYQNGDAITTDYNGEFITNKRIYNFNEWAKLYDIYEILEIGNHVALIENIKKKVLK